ncbi:MAG: DUF2062 domain-containing protein [Acidobacteriota bacterium]
MIHVTRALIRKWVEALLHIHDSPERTAAAFAVGVFWGFSPFFGMHTVLGLVCAFLFGLNRVAVVAGVYANLPWIIGPYYTLATLAGAKVMGVGLPADFASRLERLFAGSVFSATFWSGLFDLMRPLLWPFHLGSLAGAVVAAALAYWLALPAIVAGRKHLHLRHHDAAPPEVP